MPAEKAEHIYRPRPDSIKPLHIRKLGVAHTGLKLFSETGAHGGSALRRCSTGKLQTRNVYLTHYPPSPGTKTNPNIKTQLSQRDCQPARKKKRIAAPSKANTAKISNQIVRTTTTTDACCFRQSGPQ